MTQTRYDFEVGDWVECPCRPLNGGRWGIQGVVVDIVIIQYTDVYFIDLGSGVEEKIAHPDCEIKIDGVSHERGWRKI